jgi:hypothetical protein
LRKCLKSSKALGTVDEKENYQLIPGRENFSANLKNHRLPFEVYIPSEFWSGENVSRVLKYLGLLLKGKY